MQHKVIVTGATGFIGSRLVPFLRSQGYEVHLLTRHRASEGVESQHFCELTDGASLRELFDRIAPDFLVHLASRAFPSRSLDDFDLQVQNTILPATTLARVVPTSVKLALFFGSCEEYGNGPAPFQEDQALKCISPYGWAKIAAYTGTQMVAQQRKLNWCWARPFLTIGPGQNSNQLVPTLIRGCLNGQSIDLSPGEQTRDFIYIEDLCKMVHTVLQNPEKATGKVINLCSGKPRTVRSVAELIRNRIGSGELRFGATPYRVDEAMSFYGSNNRYKTLFGDPGLTSFEEALSHTIEWYKSVQQNGLPES